MTKSLIIAMMFIGLIGCSEPQKNPDDIQNKTKNLSFDEMPNEKTVFEVIEAKSIDENDALLVALQTQLLKDQFEFVEKESGTSWSENDCTNNKVIQVKGDGIRSYRAESQVKVGQKNNIRPDFSLLVFAFEDAQLAEKNFISLKTAVESDNGFCNGKSPEVIVRNGNEVFYFTSRAEMFRSYLDQYSQYVEDYKAEKQP
ncbi:hypothetical protein [Acinetobacter piscicola]|uniref:hypothetical protein n=1 Tax=Acinetobacter piscicola TaxID=2006115 RepID=UPI000B801FEA|nr:hypothetical protein [Acinetobacter piscicola]